MRNNLKYAMLLLCVLLGGMAQAAGYEGYYRIKSPRSGRYLTDANNKLTVSPATSPTEGDLNQMWQIRAIGDGSQYVFVNVATGGMVLSQDKTETDHATSTTLCSPFYIKKSGTKYIISSKSNFSGKTCWHENSRNMVVVWTETESMSQWTITPVTDSELTAAEAATAAYDSQVEAAVQRMQSMAVLERGGIYRIKSRRGRYATENSTTHKVSTVETLRDNDLSQIWVIVPGNGNFAVRNALSGRFMPNEGGSDAALVTTDAATTYYIKTSEASSEYYTLSWTEQYKGGTCLHENRSFNVVKWNANDANNTTEFSDWQFEPITAADVDATVERISARFAETQGIATQITEGYYVMVPAAYPTRALQEAASGSGYKATTILRSGRYGQVWKLTPNAAGTSCTIQNVLSERYVRNNAGTSAVFQMTTGTTGTNFTIARGGDEWNYYFNFRGSQQGFHCASSQGYDVVGWDNTIFESQWILYPAEVDEAALLLERSSVAEGADMQQNAAAYNEKLQRYFSDYACTILRPEFASATAEELTAAMQADGLPAFMQKMAVAVLTDRWDNDRYRADGTTYFGEKFNKFYKMSRVQDVECYSDNEVWREITNTGAFGELTSPTGIVGEVGDFVYIFVDDNPPTNGVLRALLAHDTGYRNAGALTLKKGLNVWQLPNSGEVFLNYFCNNSNKYLKDFPPIRVHIEGGKVNGCWDMSRGMTNEDWATLVSLRKSSTGNIFKSEFVHIKGTNTVLNVLTEKVIDATQPEEIMKGWDFAFLGLQKAIGHTGQWDGRYNPVVNPRHSYEGNPNWGGYGGSNHPGLTAGYLFNYNNFYNDNIWEILHEIGHGCQYPIKMAGTTEVTNNSLAQIVSHMMGNNYSRGNGVDKLVQLFNYERDGKRGWSWVDYVRYATPHYDASLHTGNHLLYQLYLYFEVMGHSPGFLTRMQNEMRANPIRTTGKGQMSNPARYDDDFWKFARACAKASQTDLWEFFETYGFWKYTDEIISSSEDDPEVGSADWKNGHRFIGDYGNYTMKLPVRGNAADEARMQELREYMQSMPNHAPNIFFIEDRIKPQYVDAESFVGSINPDRVGKEMNKYWNLTGLGQNGAVGDYGQYTDFDGEDRTQGLRYTIASGTASQAMATDKGGEWNYTVTGRRVTMSGDGILGIKIYDQNGKLCYIANTRTFVIPNEMADALQAGTYSLHVAATAYGDIVMDKNGNPCGTTGIGAIAQDELTAPTQGTQAVYDLQGRQVSRMLPGHIYVIGGKKVMKKA